MNTIQKDGTNIKAKIAIISDKNYRPLLIQEILTTTGYAVRTFSHSCNDVMPHLAEEHPCLVILDLSKDKEKSLEKCSCLKNDPLLKKIPFIFINSSRDHKFKNKCLKLGCVDYINKPFHYEEVLCRVQTHIKLYHMQQDLEATLAQKTQDLTRKAKELEEMVIALKILLQQRDADKKSIYTKIHGNIEKLILPNIERLKTTKSHKLQQLYIHMIEENLQQIAPPFLDYMEVFKGKLTPKEFEIANFIRQGKSTKEIAELFNLSPATIATHRRNIRKKIQLTNSKENLHTFFSIRQTG